MSAVDPFSSWAKEVERVTDEAAGAVELAVVLQTDMPELLGAAMLGNPRAVQLLQLTTQTLMRIDMAPRRNPMLCAACPRPIKSKFSLALAIPATGDPRGAIGLAVCNKCATEPADVQAKALEGFRRLWPDLRPITVHPGSSRA